jgi:hypothetical protein
MTEKMTIETVPKAPEGPLVFALDRDTATELATLVIGSVVLAASSSSSSVVNGTEPQSLRDVMERLTNAPSDGERQRLQDLATTIDQNVTFWIGASANRNMALFAIRKVLPVLQPDPRRLTAANLDPKRIAFMIVECARAEAPADFAEAVTNTLEQTNINVHILRTVILRSLEHLQRVALREWTERSFEASRTVVAPDLAPAMDLSRDAPNEGFGDRPPNLNVTLDEPISDVPAQVEVAAHAVPVTDTAAPSANGGLETELLEALTVRLSSREPGLLKQNMEVPEIYADPETATSRRHPERPHRRDGGGEARPELAPPPSQTAAPERKQSWAIRFGFLWLVALVAAGTALAALYYRGEMGAVAAALIDLFPSTR